MRRVLMLGVALVLLATPALSKVIPPDANQSQLAEQWWPWVLQYPYKTGALLDQTGAQAYLGNQDLSSLGLGKVFFIAGSSESNPDARDGIWRRSFSVPGGVPLFFPISNNVDLESPLFPPVCSTVSCALNNLPTESAYPTNLYATLDGVNLAPDGFGSFWQASDQFVTANLPDDNPFWSTAFSAESVQNGYYMELKLHPGVYTLAFGVPGGIEIVDTMKVVPEAPTWAMMLAGFGALGYMAYARARRDPIALL